MLLILRLVYVKLNKESRGWRYGSEIKNSLLPVFPGIWIEFIASRLSDSQFPLLPALAPLSDFHKHLEMHGVCLYKYKIHKLYK